MQLKDIYRNVEGFFKREDEHLAWWLGFFFNDFFYLIDDLIIRDCCRFSLLWALSDCPDAFLGIPSLASIESNSSGSYPLSGA